MTKVINLKFISTDKYDKIVDNILYVSFAIHQLFFMLSVSAFARNVKIAHYIANGIIILSFFVIICTDFYYFLRGRFSLNEIIIYILLAIPLLISLYNYRVVMVISNLFYISTFKNVDAKYSLKIAYYMTILGFIINVILGFITSHTGNVIQFRHGAERIRYGMGFYYCTIGSFYFLTIVLIMILIKNKLKLIHYLFIIIPTIIIFILTDTKAPIAYTFLSLIIYLIFVNQNNKIIDSFFSFITIICFPAATILTLFLSYTFNPSIKFYSFCNNILTGRLELTNKALSVCSWNLFGQDPGIWGDGYYIDSSIVSMLVQNGLLVLIISVVFMTFYSYIATKTKNKKLMLVLMIIALRSTFDFGFMTMQLCPVVILFYETFNKFIKYKYINP